MAALLAMFSDAAIGHALLWENDPYWTYWVTDTFLIATVFGLGTAWFGAGAVRGAALTAVHTLVLTIYYWSLSPIGLPSHPHWLDLQHTWVTGLPVHFGVYLLGYLAALWLWRRRAVGGREARGSVAGDAARALAVGTGVVVVAGVVQAVALGEFPGVTWFVMRLGVAVFFTLAWWAGAGRDRAAAVGGGITLALVLATYGHYLGPVGLPDADVRVIAQDPPPVTVHWLSYTEEWLVAFPVLVVTAVGALVAASVSLHGWTRVGIRARALVAAAAAITAVVAVGVVVAIEGGADDRRATVTAVGEPHVEEGELFRGTLTPATGGFHLVAHDRNPRHTPLSPHDALDLDADVTHPDGTRYEITATQPVVDDPTGRFGTWGGVGFDTWHHGRSGVGTPLLPPTRSEVAVVALGDVKADGKIVAVGVPVRVSTVHRGGVELAVGDPASPVLGLPDGHLRVLWPDRVGSSPEGLERSHSALGGTVLVALLLLATAAVRSEPGGRPVEF